MATVKPADLNGDGKVTPKERARYKKQQAAGGTGQDTLSMKQLEKASGFSQRFLTAYPEIQKIVAKAIKVGGFDSEQGQKNFIRDFQESTFYRTNGEYLGQYLLNEAKGGKDWDNQKATAREIVQAEAVRIGASLEPDELAFFAEQYLQNGWNEQGRDGMLTKALTGQLEGFDSDQLDYGKGGPQAIVTQLADLAKANGVKYDPAFFNGAARSVLAGLSTIDDYAAEIRKTAASYDPAHADRILAGENRRDIASPYINLYADLYDKDPNAVDLDDPYVKAAMNRTDDKGNISAMGLWDYEKYLKSQEEYGTTKRGWQEIGSITSNLVRMMGFGG